MAGGYSGDGSVRWFTDAKNVKETHDVPNPNGSGTHHQDGIDNTPPGVAGRFTIIISCPQDSTERELFRQQLLKAYNGTAGVGGDPNVTFSIPIEDQQWLRGHTGAHYYSGDGKDNQIYIDWP